MGASFYAGKTALVTGASSGLGWEIAAQLGAAGAKLVLTARRGAQLGELADRLRQDHGTDVCAVLCDLGKVGGAPELCREVDALGGSIDLVVNNAGRGLAGAFARSDVDEQTRMLRLNCEAPVVIARHFLPRLDAARGAGLINVASVAGMLSTPGMALYGATKAFVLSFSRALAEEMRGTGVRVMTLAPGPFVTEFQRVANYELGALEKLAVIPTERVARIALADFAAGKSESYPGAVMKMAKPLIGVSPSGLVTRIASQALKGRR